MTGEDSFISSDVLGALVPIPKLPAASKRALSAKVPLLVVEKVSAVPPEPGVLLVVMEVIALEILVVEASLVVKRTLTAVEADVPVF